VSRIETVFFDVGETIVDETREYGTWRIGQECCVTRFTAAFGAVIGSGGDYRHLPALSSRSRGGAACAVGEALRR